MNFEEAEKAHIQWVTRLRMYAAGTLSEKLNPDIVKIDNVCALGKWIYGEAQQIVPAADLAPLIAVHAGFHQAAAEIVLKVDQQMLAEVKELLDNPQSALNRRVHEVVSSIRQLSAKHK